MWQRVCVFAGSNSGKEEASVAAAKSLGQLLVKENCELVYGAGSIGLMGVIADAVLEAGGQVTGVIPEFLAIKELLHAELSQTIVTENMHTRKAKMAELSDAFIALPGGLGTFEEFFEVLTWAQLGVHQKPIGLLNVSQFYDPVLKLIDHAVETGFVKPEHRELLIAADNPDMLWKQMHEYVPPQLPKWSDLDET